MCTHVGFPREEKRSLRFISSSMKTDEKDFLRERGRTKRFLLEFLFLLNFVKGWKTLCAMQWVCSSMPSKEHFDSHAPRDDAWMKKIYACGDRSHGPPRPHRNSPKKPRTPLSSYVLLYSLDPLSNPEPESDLQASHSKRADIRRASPPPLSTAAGAKGPKIRLQHT